MSNEKNSKYYAKNFTLHGYKTEVSVSPVGLAVGFSKQYPASMADVEIMEENIQWHKDATSKYSVEVDLLDDGHQREKNPSLLGILLGKGY